MSLDSWKLEIKKALAVKLADCLVRFSRQEIKRLDFGVFPWRGDIEISFLLIGDSCDHNDIAAWPNYNVSNIEEGCWPEAVMPCKEMQRLWESNMKSTKMFFSAVAEVVATDSIASLIRQFSRSQNFMTTLYDPDNKRSANFCA